MSDVIVRELAEHDLDLVCRHREAMFRDAGRSDDVLEAMRRPFRTWLQPRLQDGRYFGFIALQKTVPIAGIGLMLIDWPPHPSHPEQDRRGYVLNLYVEAEYRKRGIARALMGRADAAFAASGVQFAILHATEKGRPLYADLDWHATTEMSKRLG